jgi:hypothetical protein
MLESRLGALIVQHRYRIDRGDWERFREMMAVFREYMVDVGVAHFEVWQDEKDPLLFVETVGYDSWSHFKQIEAKEPPPSVCELYESFGRLVIDGYGAVETHSWLPFDLGDD